MKKPLILLLFLLLCLSAAAQTHVTFTLSGIGGITTTTNRDVWIVPMSTPGVSGSSITLNGKYVTNSGTAGAFVVSNMNTGLYLVQVKAPPTATEFKILITSTNLGSISASTIMAAASTATFPAGNVAWAAASSDAKYLTTNNASGYYVQAGTNILLTTNVNLVTINSTGGGSGDVTQSGQNNFTGSNTFRGLTTFTNPISFNVGAVTKISIGLSGGYPAWIDASGAAAFAGIGLTSGTFSGDAGGVVNVPFTSVNGLGTAARSNSAAFQPASANLTNFGTINTNGVHLATASYNAAIAFANNNSVTDTVARVDLVDFATDLANLGINAVNTDSTQTNLVDAAFFAPRFNARSNGLTWAGSTITASNIVWDNWGAGFNGNSLITFPIADSRTNTFVIVWRGYRTNYNTGVQQWLGGLINSNPTKYSAQWFYMPNTELKFSFRETNTYFGNLGNSTYIQPWYSTDYNWGEVMANMNQRRVTATTSTGIGGGGIYTFYNNGLPAQYGLVSPAFSLTNTAIVPTNALNQVLLGVDNLGPGSGFLGGYLKGQIAAVLVFNKPVTDSQMVWLYKGAVRRLEASTVNYVFYGDSRFTIDAWSNSIPDYMLGSGALTNVATWRNASQGGKKLYDYFTAQNSNTWLYMDAPYGKCTETRFYDALGINDAYGNGDSIANMWFNASGIVSQATANGIRSYEFTVYPMWTNSNSGYVYNPTYQANIDGFNDTIITNGNLFAGVVRPELIIGQNELNTNNGASLDGLHVAGAAGTALNKRVADLALGLESAPNIGGKVRLTSLTNFINGDEYVSGVRYGNGSGLTNLNGSEIRSGTVPVARLGSGATATTLLHGNSVFSAVDLAADVTGKLPASGVTSSNSVVAAGSNITVTTNVSGSTTTFTVAGSAGGGSTNAWNTNGNAGLVAGSFIGTIDSIALTLKTFNHNAAIFQTVSGYANTTFGDADNSIANTVFGGTVSGGTSNTIQNSANPYFNTIAGGQNNTIAGNAGWAFIGGGQSNSVNGINGIAMGHSANAQFNNSFVFADSQGANYYSSNTDSVNFRAQGGFNVQSGGILAGGTNFNPGAGTIQATNRLAVTTTAIGSTNTLQIDTPQLAKALQIDTNGNSYFANKVTVTGKFITPTNTATDGFIVTATGTGGDSKWGAAAAGSQTPITSDINVAGFSFTNMSNLRVTNTAIIGGGQVAIDSTNTFQVNTPAAVKSLQVDTNGNTYLGGSLTVTGSSTNTAIAGNTTVYNLNATNNVSVTNNLTVAGTAAVTGNITNSALTASRLVLSDSNKALTSAAASGAVSVDADGSATTAAQVNALFPGIIVTNGASSAITLSNNFAVTGGNITNSVLTASKIVGTDSGKALTSISTSANLSLSGGTLDTIQGIQTTSTPQFTRLGLGQAADAVAALGVTGTAIISSRITNSVLTASQLAGTDANKAIQSVGLSANFAAYSTTLDTVQGIQTSSSPTFLALTANNSVTAQGYYTLTNLYVGTVLPMGTNYNISLSSNLLFTGLANIPTTTEGYGKITAKATGTVTITNPASMYFSDGLTNRTLTNGNLCELVVHVIPGFSTNVIYSQYWHP